MNNKLKTAINAYMEGIRDGNAYAVEKYTGERYTQHSGGVGDGTEGFIAFFKPFLERNPIRDIKVVRGFTDGQYVFAHVFQSLNNGEAKWVTMDMFDTDTNDKIIEHWDVISEYQATPSGNDMVEGPSETQDLDKTEDNKALVTHFLKSVFVEGKDSTIERFIDGNCIQHSPEMENGIAGWINYFNTGVRYEFVHKVIGEGNFVVALSKSFKGDTEYAVFNLFRVENGKIAEHWDAIEEIAPKGEWANSGKF